MSDKLLSERIYSFLKRQDRWVTKTELIKRAQAKGYSHEEINGALEVIGNDMNYPDVVTVYQDEKYRNPPVPDYIGEAWRVDPMTEEEKETHRSAIAYFLSLPDKA